VFGQGLCPILRAASNLQNLFSKRDSCSLECGLSSGHMAGFVAVRLSERICGRCLSAHLDWVVVDLFGVQWPI
jgi:hypothetical protein